MSPLNMRVKRMNSKGDNTDQRSRLLTECGKHLTSRATVLCKHCAARHLPSPYLSYWGISTQEGHWSRDRAHFGDSDFLHVPDMRRAVRVVTVWMALSTGKAKVATVFSPKSVPRNQMNSFRSRE